MVIKRDHYVNQVIAKRWMSYMSRCVKRIIDDGISDGIIDAISDGVCGYNVGDAMIVCAGSVIAVIWVNN